MHEVGSNRYDQRHGGLVDTVIARVVMPVKWQVQKLLLKWKEIAKRRAEGRSAALDVFPSCRPQLAMVSQVLIPSSNTVMGGPELTPIAGPK